MRVKVHLHNKKYKSKPKDFEIVKINNEITNKVKEIDIEKLAREVGEKGKTFTVSVFHGKRVKENFRSQQVFCLDFDKGFTINEFKERAEYYGVYPSIIYNTFSNTKECPRFRVVFVCDCEIFSEEAAYILIYMLHEIFPESDKHCKDVTRMFFGGNKLVFMDDNASINFLDLSFSLQAFLKNKDSKNYSRKIESIGRKMRVQVKKSSLCIMRLHNKVGISPKSEELSAMTGIYIRVDAVDSSLFYLIEKKREEHLGRRRKKKEGNAYKVRGISKELLLERCPLLMEFYEKDITHEQKFLIATNLCHVSGGEKLFFDGNINHVEKWKEEWRYLNRNDYRPQYCANGNCPYYERCRSPTILDRISKKIIKNRIEIYSEIDESEKILENYMIHSILAEEKGIYLISAQTSLGKTSMYCKIVKNHYEKKQFMLVVPTTKLQKEVGEELNRLGVPVFLTENIYLLLQEIHLDDLKAKVEYLYKRGFGYKVRSLIKEYITNNELNDAQYSRLNEYLGSKEGLEDYKCIVTTHAMFLSLRYEVIRKYEVVIDEDILMNIFKNTASIGFDDLRLALKEEAIPKEERCFVEQLLEASNDTVRVKNPLELTANQLEYIYNKKLKINASLVDFLQANSYHVDMLNKRIDYFNAKRIPDIKMTIVSATLKEELYKNYCMGQKICMMEVPAAKYKGKLIQYTAHSMSRSNVSEVGYDNMIKYVDKIIGSGKRNIITFKKYTGDSEIYYGKSEGYNEYKGKDLVVIGTPHNVPFVYYLIGAYLEYDIEDKLCVRMTENDTYSFKFMTFENIKMRNLQFYFIESELEQAIGRARLLRYDCNVYLFSNYPCRQAEIIEEEYLEETNKE